MHSVTADQTAVGSGDKIVVTGSTVLYTGSFDCNKIALHYGFWNHDFMFQMNKCQLTTRHWYITDENGVNEEVHGDGVVGEFPVMTPGALHEYISCTTFSTPTGTMNGHYEFQYLNKKGSFHVEIPPMNFKSLPFVIAEKRLSNLSEGKFEEECSSSGSD